MLRLFHPFRYCYRFFLQRHPRKTLVGLLLFSGWYYFCLPQPLFEQDQSLVLESQAGQLLGAQIASDGQWRFPAVDSVPPKFATALLQFEDKRFYQHIGIDFLGLANACRQNIAAAAVVRGGSTLSMQLIRLSLQANNRNIFQKLYEMLLATRLELAYSKKEILSLYASQAPFGGNVVGLDAAAWRYFGKSPWDLSWGQAATLAVLPNSPALIHPGRNRKQLLRKRNFLIQRLQERGFLDSLSAELAMAEPLPQAPLPLPRWAPHLLDWAKIQYNRCRTGQKRIRSSLQLDIQQRAHEVLHRQHQILRSQGIHNAAALITDVETGRILAYVGNIWEDNPDVHAPAVDIVQAPRSTGSILKPFLYALCLEDGLIAPSSLIDDIPLYLNGYRPLNFNERYDGVVPAKRALIRSLNIPMVRLLQQYGVRRFHHQLQRLGMTTLTEEASHYGLPLILGGAEAKLYDLVGIYASMARCLNHYVSFEKEKANGRYYDANDFRPLSFDQNIPFLPAPPEQRLEFAPYLSAASIYQTLDAMRQLERPDNEGGWQHFSSAQPIAWKTGTSFGFRDAWAVGVTTKYAIGVWVGNADGAGRPDLIGAQAAAPLLFQLFELLPKARQWFEEPKEAMAFRLLCQQSGYQAGPHCVHSDTLPIGKQAKSLKVCPFHRPILLDSSGQFRVQAECLTPSQMEQRNWFVLPPIQEYYYQRGHPTYAQLPPWKVGCRPSDEQVMQWIFPKNPTRIYIPTDFDGKKSRTVLRVAHRQADTQIFWHLDQQFLGTTKGFHQMELNPPAGEHQITLVDEAGRRLEQQIVILDKPKD